MRRRKHNAASRRQHQERADDEDRDIVGDLADHGPSALYAPDSVQGQFDIGEQFHRGPDQQDYADSGNDAAFGVLECPV